MGSKIGFLPVVGWSRDRQVDRKPRLTDRGLLCLVVARRLLGVASERRWVRDVRQDLIGLFACLPHRSGYGKRVRSLGGLISAV
ncbi:MAG: IS982 family transposase, partial [Actinophytocola sp.]